MKKLLFVLLLIPFLGNAQILDYSSVQQPSRNPQANAGGNQTIALPITTVTLTGSGIPYGSATITGYQWVKTSGTGGTITSPTSASTTVTGLSAGTYVFTLTVTDNGSLTGSNGATITVNPLPSITITGSLSNFTNVTGTNSANQSFNTSISNAQADGTVTAPAWLELSLTGTSGWTSPLNVVHSGGSFTGQPVSIFVRTKTTATAGSYGPTNITVASTNATTQNISATATISGATTKDSAKFSFSKNPVTTVGWVNVNGDPSVAIRTGTGGLSSTITLTTVSTSNWTQFGGACTFTPVGVNAITEFNSNGFYESYPASVALEGYYQAHPSGGFSSSIPQLIIGGLKTDGTTYRISMSGSDHFEQSFTDYYVFGSTLIGPANPPNGIQTGTSGGAGNSTAGYTFITVTPNGSGQIKVYVLPGVTMSSIDGVINGITINEE